ncbi:hypothetical protein B566_EDAN011779 [Ephemera danica]|nr:hypothetical protein B566_EDAN011779 [Ephemera danica]
MALFGDTFSSKSFWQNGPTPGANYNFPGTGSSYVSQGSQRTQNPATMGTSVLGMKFKDGVLIAADTLGSYGSLARFRNCPRVMKVNDNIVLGAGGDYADYQYLQRIIQQKVVKHREARPLKRMDETITDDGFAMKPKSLYCWLTRVMYNRRSKFDPLWNYYVVGGMQGEVPFLGAVDLRGLAYEDKCVATGYGAHIALPLLRDGIERNPEMTRQQAEQLMERCMEVLYYRDARSFPKFQIACCTAEGVTVSDVKELKSNWEVAHMVR